MRKQKSLESKRQWWDKKSLWLPRKRKWHVGIWTTIPHLPVRKIMSYMKPVQGAKTVGERCYKWHQTQNKHGISRGHRSEGNCCHQTLASFTVLDMTRSRGQRSCSHNQTRHLLIVTCYDKSKLLITVVGICRNIWIYCLQTDTARTTLFLHIRTTEQKGLCSDAAVLSGSTASA